MKRYFEVEYLPEAVKFIELQNENYITRKIIRQVHR